MRNDAIGHPGNDSLPRIPVNMKTLVAGVRQGYRLFQTGKFNDAKNAFSEVLAQIPLTVTDNRNDVNEIKKMLEICREYITAIRIKGAMTPPNTSPLANTNTVTQEKSVKLALDTNEVTHDFQYYYSRYCCKEQGPEHQEHARRQMFEFLQVDQDQPTHACVEGLQKGSPKLSDKHKISTDIICLL